MTVIKYRFEMNNDEIFEGEYETSEKLSDTSSVYEKKTIDPKKWDKVRKEILGTLPMREEKLRVEVESFEIIEFSKEPPSLAKQQDFEGIFLGKIANPKISGKWLMYECLTPKSFNNLALKAKEKGFKSAFYREGKVGVLVDDLITID